MTKKHKIGLVLGLAALLYAASGCFYTRAIFNNLGAFSEPIERYESAFVCDGQFYVSYLVTVDNMMLVEPYVEMPFVIRLALLLGAIKPGVPLVPGESHQPRFVEVPLDAMDWIAFPVSPRNDPLPGPSPRKVVPTFGDGPIPVDLTRCEKALAVAFRLSGSIGAPRPELFFGDLIEPLARDSFAVLAYDNAIAIFRKVETGTEWALVGDSDWPRYTYWTARTYRSWWSYPAIALALGPAVVIDVITSPIAILFRHVRY